MNSLEGKLLSPSENDKAEADYRLEMVQLFKSRKVREARELLCSHARPDEMEEIYTWMYRNVELFGNTREQQDQAVLIIKQGLVDHTICADSEINLAATLIKLARNLNG